MLLEAGLKFPTYTFYDTPCILLKRCIFIFSELNAWLVTFVRDFGNSPLVALCCLKGGYQFFAHLCEFMINYNGSSGMFQNIVTFMMHTNFVSKETTMKRKWRVLCCVVITVVVFLPY